MFRNAIQHKFGSPGGTSNMGLVGSGMIGQNQIASGVTSTGLPTSNAYNSYMDDSIGSFMGSLTPTRIDSSPAHGQR